MEREAMIKKNDILGSPFNATMIVSDVSLNMHAEVAPQGFWKLYDLTLCRVLWGECREI